MKSRRKISGDHLEKSVNWHLFIKVGTFVKFIDDGVVKAGQVTEVDKKCSVGRYLRIRKFNESLSWGGTYYKNHEILSIHCSPKRGCWVPIKEHNKGRNKVKTLPIRYKDHVNKK